MNIRRANSGIRMASHRLVLREFVVTDEDAVHAFAADPLVTRFTDWGPNSVEDTRAFLAEAPHRRPAHSEQSSPWPQSTRGPAG